MSTLTVSHTEMPIHSSPRRLPFGRSATLFRFPEGPMLRWSLIFLIIALVAAALGFGGIAAAAAGIAKVLFYIFLVLFLITLIAGLAVGRRITG